MDLWITFLFFINTALVTAIFLQYTNGWKTGGLPYVFVFVEEANLYVQLCADACDFYWLLQPFAFSSRRRPAAVFQFQQIYYHSGLSKQSGRYSHWHSKRVTAAYAS
jgi:hypothetical protein